jgi:hypothetical protein
MRLLVLVSSGEGAAMMQRFFLFVIVVFLTVLSLRHQPRDAIVRL